MPITFEPGQPFELHLPGGTIKAKVVQAGQYPGDWIVHVDDEDNPLEETLKGEARG
jgi:hypothetical protein